MQTLLNAASKQNKENPANEQAKQVRRLKIELNDRIFQLRKLQQDHAEDKAKLYIQMQKQKLNNSKILAQYKNRIKQDNQIWSLKMDQIKMEYSQKIEEFRIENQRTVKTEIEARVQVLKQQYQAKMQHLQATIKELEETIRKQRIMFNQQRIKIRQNISFKFEKAQLEQLQKHNTIIRDIRRQYDGKVAALQKINAQEEVKYFKIKQELQAYITQNVKQKIKAEQNQRSMISDIETSKNQLQQLNSKIKQLEETLYKTKQQYERQLNTLQQDNNKEIRTLTQNFTYKENHLTQTYQANVQMLRKQVEQLVKIHKNKERLWQQRGKQVLQLFQKRQSKKQDVKAIQKLQIQLIKRDFMLQKQRNEIKNCKLQLQNMEEIYDRIFISNSNLSRTKTKSYNIKKYKNTNILNESIRSTIISEKKLTVDK